MGKPQGDGLPDPTYYEREVDGEIAQRPAYTPTDHVNLTARGWRQVQTSQAAERPADTEVARPAGSQRRAGAPAAVAQPVAGAEGGASNA